MKTIASYACCTGSRALFAINLMVNIRRTHFTFDPSLRTPNTRHCERSVAVYDFCLLTVAAMDCRASLAMTRGLDGAGLSPSSALKPVSPELKPVSPEFVEYLHLMSLATRPRRTRLFAAHE